MIEKVNSAASSAARRLLPRPVACLMIIGLAAGCAEQTTSTVVASPEWDSAAQGPGDHQAPNPDASDHTPPTTTTTAPDAGDQAPNPDASDHTPPTTTTTAPGAGDQAPNPDAGGSPGPGQGEEPGPQVPTTEDGADDGSDDLDGLIAGDQAGPLRWKPPSPWAAVVDEVLDMCDDVQALAAITGRLLGPGDFMTGYDRERIESERRLRHVSCDGEPGAGKRYVLMTETGFGPPATTASGAVEAVERRRRSSPILSPEPFLGHLLGYEAPFDDYHVETPRDEVVVLTESVLARDGVLRGLVQNMSESMFARDVTVSVGDGRWVWPLTMQPAEVAPFAIENYAGTTDPTIIAFEVTASLTPVPDPSRSIATENAPGDWWGTWSEFLSSFFPPFAVDEPPEGEFGFYSTSVLLRAPTSHPSIADEVMGQTIEDFRAYSVDLNSQRRVVDIRRLDPYLWLPTGQTDDGVETYEWVKITRLPYFNPHTPDAHIDVAMVGYIPAERGVLILGGANSTAGNSDDPPEETPTGPGP